MQKANSNLVAQMTQFMENLSTMQTKKALEVACGECMVSRDILLDKFFEIDLMDQSIGAIEFA